jgi:hypothetical protein
MKRCYLNQESINEPMIFSLLALYQMSQLISLTILFNNVPYLILFPLPSACPTHLTLLALRNHCNSNRWRVLLQIHARLIIGTDSRLHQLLNMNAHNANFTHEPEKLLSHPLKRRGLFTILIAQPRRTWRKSLRLTMHFLRHFLLSTIPIKLTECSSI